MEDTHFVHRLPSAILVGVCDGDGGPSAAERVWDQFPKSDPIPTIDDHFARFLASNRDSCNKTDEREVLWFCAVLSEFYGIV